jgi:MFS family permease
MLGRMPLILDSFWRAVVYCLHPRVVFLSLLPLFLMVVLMGGLGYFFWDVLLDQVRNWLDTFAVSATLWNWLENMGAARLKTVIAPLLVIFAVTPLIVMISLLTVALSMTPALVNLVAANRFANLQRLRGASLLNSVFWSLGSTLAALIALLVSIPLWAIPPLVLILPPLIWGWLTYRVMAFDALADHASEQERRMIFRKHRLALFAMGVVSGFLGAAPSLVWASGALFAAAFVLLMPAAIWIYTLVFAFSSLWYAHFCLAALEALRASANATGQPLISLDKK